MEKTSQIVNLFVTCLVDSFFPNVGLATAGLLEKQGLTVNVPMKQSCCGQPAFNGGHWEEARPLARHTLDVLSQTQGPIILPSGSCGEMIRHHYHDLLADEPAYVDRLNDVASRTFELTQFLVDELGVTDVGANCNGCATYHPSCHGLRGLNLRTQPQALLNQVEGLNLTELPAAEECCGFGGLFSVKMSDISGAMLKLKLDNIEASGADTVVGGDVSCLMNIAGGLRRRGSDIEVKHIAELLNPQPDTKADDSPSWGHYIALGVGLLTVVVLLKWLLGRNKKKS